MGAVGDCWQDFDVAVGRWRLGKLELEMLPAVALETLGAGCNTPSLVRLAAMDGASWSEVEPILGRVFEERGRPLPSPEEAVASVADDLLRRLVAEELDPHGATEKLRRLAWEVVNGPAWPDLEAFVALSDSWERPGRRPRPRARRLAGRSGRFCLASCSRTVSRSHRPIIRRAPVDRLPHARRGRDGVPAPVASVGTLLLHTQRLPSHHQGVAQRTVLSIDTVGADASDDQAHALLAIAVEPPGGIHPERVRCGSGGGLAHATVAPRAHLACLHTMGFGLDSPGWSVARR
jgi:hypothetical protein